MSTPSPSFFFSAGEPYVPLNGLRLTEPIPVAQPEVPPLLDMDGVQIFVMIASLLFVVQLKTVGALLFAISAIIFAWRHRDLVVEVFRSRALFLVFPAYTMLSVVWSEAPVETIRHSIEFAFTVIVALLVARVRNRRSMMFALFTAFSIYCLVTLMFGNMVEVGTTGTQALSGLADSKNEEASTATMGAIVTLAWLFIGFKTRRYFQCLLALPVLAIEIFAAVLGRSAGALAALGAGLFVFLLLTILIRAGLRVRAALVGLCGMTALTIALLFLVFTGPIVEFMSDWFDKDFTPTGRTYLWTRARDLIVEQPFLGRGFSAFWQQGNLDAEGLWQFAHIGSSTQFNFHNTGYDILVSLGWVGLGLFVLTLILGLVRTASTYVKQPSLLAAFWLATGASLLVRLPIETIGTGEFSFGTILLFASLGYIPAAAQTDEATGTWASRRTAARFVPHFPVKP